MKTREESTTPAPARRTRPAVPTRPATPARPAARRRTAEAPPISEPSAPAASTEDGSSLPESYGVSRLRLLARDPESLFAHWDVDPAVLARVESAAGPRSAALARLTLRVSGPGGAPPAVVFVSPRSRTGYLRAHRGPGKYRAELGLTLPSGEFVRLAESNTVWVPRTGPSGRRAVRRVRFERDRFPVLEPAETDADGGGLSAIDDEPWPEGEPGPVEDAPKGGASDAYRR